MDTKLLQIETLDRSAIESLASAANILKHGGLVAFPTETVYGLGANALDARAAGKIYEAKGRPSDNPLIAHISDKKDLKPLVAEIPKAATLLMDAFWPGPLTIIFKKSEVVPYGTTGGLDTVAVRMPSHPIALKLIGLAGIPIAAPSANTSGRPSPSSAAHVVQDMDGKIDMIIDGGEVGIGVESTIVDVTESIPIILRPGAITRDMIKEILGNISIDIASMEPIHKDTMPKAPGMKYRHYAPTAELTLVSGNTEKVVEKINLLAKEKIQSGLRVGIIATDETIDNYTNGICKSIGTRSEESTIAHNMYRVLREFDDLQVDYIYSETFSNDNLGYAIMNRLTKAAAYQIIKL